MNETKIDVCPKCGLVCLLGGVSESAFNFLGDKSNFREYVKQYIMCYNVGALQ